jgi:hypothetical protein
MREGGRIIAGAQLLRRKVPLLGWIYYLSGGPLITPSFQDREPLVRQLSQSLQGLLETHCPMLFIQPHFDGSRMSDELIELGFRPSEVDIAPTATLRIDLSRHSPNASATPATRRPHPASRAPARSSSAVAGGNPKNSR